MASSILKNTKHILVGDKTYEYFDSQHSNEYSLVFFNGFRMPLSSWANVIPCVLNIGRVVAYNRPGVGGSTKAAIAQTADIVINDFRSFAHAINLSPPYLIVAHSLGGIYANYYARMHPHEVSGIVFVESPHPDEIKEQKKIKPPLILRGLNEGLKYLEKIFDRFKYSEDDAVLDSVAQIKSLKIFPDIPITVITGVQKLPFVPQDSFEMHLIYQKELVAITSDSVQVLAQKSGHFPQVTEPELVVKEIETIVSRL